MKSVYLLQLNIAISTKMALHELSCRFNLKYLDRGCLVELRATQNVILVSAELTHGIKWQC